MSKKNKNKKGSRKKLEDKFGIEDFSNYYQKNRSNKILKNLSSDEDSEFNSDNIF